MMSQTAVGRRALLRAYLRAIFLGETITLPVASSYAVVKLTKMEMPKDAMMTYSTTSHATSGYGMYTVRYGT